MAHDNKGKPSSQPGRPVDSANVPENAGAGIPIGSLDIPQWYRECQLDLFGPSPLAVTDCTRS